VADDIRATMYAQALETFRSLLANGIQAATILLIAYTTIVGFALTRQSVGLLAADLLLLLALLAIEQRVMAVTEDVLIVAKACEDHAFLEATGDAATADTHRPASLVVALRNQLPKNRRWRNRYVWLLTIVAVVAHIGVVIWLLVVQNWTFVGEHGK
jgi:hypothetical protein